ncbi:MAG: alpha/beta hydrolase [Methanotrichaceae archaeon]
MEKNRIIAALLITLIAAIVIGILSLSDSKQEWRVSDEGVLEYSITAPEYQLMPLKAENNTTLYDIEFTSRGTQISGLLLVPGQLNGDKAKNGKAKSVPGIVLLPGATVTKEREQGLAKYLCSLGYASITLDQRNLGGIDMDGDLQMFLKGQEPTENKMVYDALAAAEILRSRPEIDPNRIIYAGESNGARFAIIACALDPKACGVIALSTSGFGVNQAIASGMLNNPEMIRFYRSIDPETYLARIPPRELVMMHSQQDPIIPYEQGLELFSKGSGPKAFYAVNCSVHGRCADMDTFIKRELKNMSS